MLKQAILDSDFLKNFEASQIREIVECMFEQNFPQTDFIYKEGDGGTHFYVIDGKLIIVDLIKLLK